MDKDVHRTQIKYEILLFILLCTLTTLNLFAFHILKGAVDEHIQISNVRSINLEKRVTVLERRLRASSSIKDVVPSTRSRD